MQFILIYLFIYLFIYFPTPTYICKHREEGGGRNAEGGREKDRARKSRHLLTCPCGKP